MFPVRLYQSHIYVEDNIKNILSVCKNIELPFVPYIGLRVKDSHFEGILEGEESIESVIYDTTTGVFHCFESMYECWDEKPSITDIGEGWHIITPEENSILSK